MNLKHEYQKTLYQAEWVETAKRIKLRDGYLCRSCFSSNKVLQVHHSYYVWGRMPWEYPEKSLITLCNECHSLEHIENRTPNFNEGELDLLKIETPHLYEQKLYQTNEAKLEIKKRTEQKIIDDNNKKIEKREDFYSSIIALILMPFIVFFNAARIFIIAIVSFGVPMYIAFTADNEIVPSGLKLFLIPFLGFGLNYILSKLWPKRDDHF